MGNRNDVWQLDADSGAWTVLRKGDLGKGGDPDAIFNKANGQCDFPSDFMQLDMDSPERRESALLSWDVSGKKVWLFGGKGDCGPLRDVWALIRSRRSGPATMTRPRVGLACATSRLVRICAADRLRV